MSIDVLVVGLGYVGLPLAREAVFAGLKVVGFDLNGAVAERLNSGYSHVDHAVYDLDLIGREGRLVLDTRGRLTGGHVATL